MIKKTLACTICLSILLIGCGSTGISQQEYDSVVAERDAYKAQLDSLLSENEIEQNNTSEQSEEDYTKEEANTTLSPNSPSLSTGTYIVGEDIDEGKYNFVASDGTGSFKIYKSYDDYKNDEHGFDAFSEYDVLANDASVGLLNKDVYTDIVANIRLINGQCLVIDKGLELQYQLSESTDPTVLSVGTYVVGEDIEIGKYDFTATSGSGSIKIYNSYNDYLEDDYGFDAFSDYDMKAPNASVGLLNEDVYSESISNIRLEDGQCLVIEKGLKLEYRIKE